MAQSPWNYLHREVEKRMDKKRLLGHILQQLEALYQNAVDSANRAHQSATDSESVAENKYDTQGLEAAYLAEGQTRRVHDCARDVSDFKSFAEDCGGKTMQCVCDGAFVAIEDSDGVERQLFMSQVGGGLKVVSQGKEIMLITSSAPLSRVMQGLALGDEFEVSIKGEKKNYFITALS